MATQHLVKQVVNNDRKKSVRMDIDSDTLLLIKGFMIGAVNSYTFTSSTGDKTEVKPAAPNSMAIGVSVKDANGAYHGCQIRIPNSPAIATPQTITTALSGVIYGNKNSATKFVSGTAGHKMYVKRAHQAV